MKSLNLFSGQPLTARDQQGRWQSGQSGNARGRPVGARNRATVACEALLDGEAEAITRKAIELAKAGDATAIRLCLERILPARRGRPVAIELPSVTTAAELPRLMQAIMAAVSAGDITPEEAGALTAMAEQTRRAFELANFDARIRALEGCSAEA